MKDACFIDNRLFFLKVRANTLCRPELFWLCEIRQPSLHCIDHMKQSHRLFLYIQITIRWFVRPIIIHFSLRKLQLASGVVGTVPMHTTLRSQTMALDLASLTFPRNFWFNQIEWAVKKNNKKALHIFDDWKLYMHMDYSLPSYTAIPPRCNTRHGSMLFKLLNNRLGVPTLFETTSSNASNSWWISFTFVFTFVASKRSQSIWGHLPDCLTGSWRGSEFSTESLHNQFNNPLRHNRTNSYTSSYWPINQLITEE